MINRILLRAAVLIGGFAAAAAIGLGISGGPASADNHPVRGLIGAVDNLVHDVLPAPAATPRAAAEDKPAAKPKPHKRDRPVHKTAQAVGDVVRGAKNAVDHLGRPASAPPAPAVDSDDGPPTEDAPAATSLLGALLGPAVTAAPTTTPALLDSCAASTRALGSTAGDHRSSLAAPGRRPHHAAPAPPAELAPQPPPPSTPQGANGSGLISPAPSAPSIDALPATFEHCAPQTPGAVFGGDRDAASRPTHPSAPSG